MQPPSVQPSAEPEPVWATLVPERSPGTEGMSVDGDFVVVDGRGEMLRGLNATGAAVWELIDGRRPVVEIAVAIAQRYSQPFPKVLRDVIAFAHALSVKKMVRLRGGDE